MTEKDLHAHPSSVLTYWQPASLVTAFPFPTGVSSKHMSWDEASICVALFPSSPSLIVSFFGVLITGYLGEKSESSAPPSKS